MDAILPPDEARAAALGDALTRLLDRRLALETEIAAVDKLIYEELVNRLQSQIGAMADVFDRRLTALELGR